MLHIFFLIISFSSIAFCLCVAIGGLISFFEFIGRMKMSIERMDMSISTFDNCLCDHVTQLNRINRDLNVINDILKPNKPTG